MAGVASPMMRRTRAGAARFLAGLTVGGAAGGLVLALPVYLLGTAVTSVVPWSGRVLLLVGICVALAVADLRHRTPHVWRQVPQALVRTLPPGSLGVVWGFDLGLLFTTQKTTSLIWAALAAIILLEPPLAAAVLVGVAVVASVGVTVWSLSLGRTAGLPDDVERGARWQSLVRRGTGVLLLATAAVTTAQALGG